MTEHVAPGRLELQLEKSWMKWSPNPSAEKQRGGKKRGKGSKGADRREEKPALGRSSNCWTVSYFSGPGFVLP